MRAFATRARTAPLLIALALAAPAPAAAAPGAPAKPAAAKPFERRLHPYAVRASSFLWNDSNKFLENYHPNYAVDDDPATAWVADATSGGQGESLGLWLGWLDSATRVRLRVRNGCQASKDAWKANARAKEVDVALTPQGFGKSATLTDTDGWQEIVVDVPTDAVGLLSAVEIRIGSVYPGTRSTNLCISDVQVFATATERDDPANEKRKLAELTRWRSTQRAAAKLFAAKQAELPIYPAYEVRKVGALTRPTGDWGYAGTLPELAVKDPGFTKEWKDALAAAQAVEKNLGSMTRAQLAPTSQTRLVEVHGLKVANLYDLSGTRGTFQELAIRLPMLGLVSAMFTDQLRAADVQTGPTIAQYQQAPKDCGTDLAWVARTKPKEGPSRVAAIAVGRCAQVVGRGGPEIDHVVEIMIYDPTGKLVLASTRESLQGYRWTMEGGKPMLAGGRTIMFDGSILEARRATAAPAAPAP
jgi:hypothetical protein